MTSTTPSTTTSRPATALVLAATLALALGSAGCSKYGCFEWTEIEYDDYGGCPSQDQALSFFNTSACGEVESVDSEGEYEDGFCCYEISKTGNDDLYCL